MLDLSEFVPASATAVTLNLTGVEPTANTYVTAWPAGTARPPTSTLNLVAGTPSPNLATVMLGTGRKVNLYNEAGSVEVLVDLTGFYTPEFGAAFTPVTPTRVLDTRNGTGTYLGSPGAIGARTVARFHPDQRIPDNAIAAAMNLTGVATTSSTYVGTTPLWVDVAPAARDTSVLNLVAGQTAANLVVVPLWSKEPDARLAFYNHSGNTHLIADLAGYFWMPPEPCPSVCSYAWGNNLGDLATGTTTRHVTSPTPQLGLASARAVDNRIALMPDGTVRSWGANRYGQLGAGWLGGYSTVPVRVPGLTNVVAVADADDARIALRSDGTVWEWGHTIGRPDLDYRSVPRQVPGLTRVTSISASYRAAYAVREDGTVWSWGDDSFGQLGDGAAGGISRVPVQVSGLTGVTVIAGTRHNGYAVRGDGTTWAWGLAGFGQLGNGTCTVPSSCLSAIPVQVSHLTGVTNVIATHDGAMALDTDGRVWAWGGNWDGQLGNGTTEGQVNTPVQVIGLPPIQALYRGERSARAMPA